MCLCAHVCRGRGDMCTESTTLVIPKASFFFLLRQGTSLAWNFLYKPSKFKAKEAL